MRKQHSRWGKKGVALKGIIRSLGLTCTTIVVKSLSYSDFFETPWTAASQSPLPFIICWSSLKLMSLSWWCHPIIASSLAHFSSWPQSFPASGSFLRSRLFTSGGHRIGAAAAASVLPMSIQGWFPLGLIDFISLLPMGLSRIFSSTTVGNHEFLGA